MLQCFNELRQMLQTPIKPYSPTQAKKSSRSSGSNNMSINRPLVRDTSTNSSTTAGLGVWVGSGDEEERVSSPHQHSSSDAGSDLEELLTKDYPQEDLPSLITRAIGKGECVYVTTTLL